MAATLPGFRPTLWSSNIIVDLNKTLVFGALANSNYQGDVVKGNAVTILEVGDVTVGNYVENEDMTRQVLSGAERKMNIDQAKYFNFGVDKILETQTVPSMISAGSAKAALAIRNTVDQFIAGKYKEAGIVTSGLGSASSGLAVYATHLTAASSLLGMFTNMSRYADEAELSTEGRWFVMSPVIHSYLVFAGLVDNTNKGGIKDVMSGVGNGFVGNFMGWNLYVSNNVAKTSTIHHCMFGTTDAIAYAGQIAEIYTGKIPSQFGNEVAGLYVYGAKVARPNKLGVAHLVATGLST